MKVTKCVKSDIYMGQWQYAMLYNNIFTTFGNYYYCVELIDVIMQYPS